MRGAIDQRRDKAGRFIITGSSSPELTAHISDSLAGRIGIIYLGTLKANEYYEKPLSNFYQIFTKKNKDELNIAVPQLTNKQMRHCWLYGGYPEPLLRNSPQFFSEPTIKEYLEIAEQTFIWRNIYYDANSKVKSIVKKTKGFIRDTGLLNFLLRLYNMDDLLLSPVAGFTFESFIIEELIKGIEAAGIMGVDYSYYRTAKGAEVDLVVNCQAGCIPIEIKMASSVTMKQLSALKKYIADNNSPYGLLINQSEHVFWLTDKILQVPIGCL